MQMAETCLRILILGMTYVLINITFLDTVLIKKKKNHPVCVYAHHIVDDQNACAGICYGFILGRPAVVPMFEIILYNDPFHFSIYHPGGLYVFQQCLKNRISTDCV